MNIIFRLILVLLFQTVISTSSPVQLQSEGGQRNGFNCIRVNDCDIYNWLIDDGNYGVIGFPKHQVEVLLKKDECGLTQQGKVEKGKNIMLF